MRKIPTSVQSYRLVRRQAWCGSRFVARRRAKRCSDEYHPLEVYRFFRDTLQARHIQFIPIVERTTSENLTASAKRWGEQKEAEHRLYTQAIKFGRNAACRCGSGKKYTHCRGAGTGAEGEPAPLTR